MRTHRKRQKVHTASASAADGAVPEGASTALATQSIGAGLVFGTTIVSQNAQLYISCVQKALIDPLPIDSFAGFSELSVIRQREVLIKSKQKVPFCTVFLLLLFFFVSYMYTDVIVSV